MPQYTLENYVHVLACSNSKRALHIDAEDRRWFVPRITEETKPIKYWQDLHAWLNGGGRGIIAGWAEQFLKVNAPVLPGDRAPHSIAKAEIINESRSEGAMLAYEIGQLASKWPGKVVIAIEDVRKHVAEARHMSLDDRRLEKPLTLRKALRQAGLFEPSPRADGEVHRFTITPVTGRSKFKSYVVANFLIEEHMEWTDIKDWYRTPGDLMPM